MHSISRNQSVLKAIYEGRVGGRKERKKKRWCIVKKADKLLSNWLDKGFNK